MAIQHSEQLNELFSALSKVQGKLENAKKNKQGFQKNHKYADLSQYLEESKELLAEHGLCIMQIPGPMKIVEVTKEIYNKQDDSYEFQNILTPNQTITTWIGHDSGQFISGNMEIIVEKTSGNSWGQSTGGAVSFARRYALAGSLGMTQEDNDNQYSQKDVEKSYKTQQKSPVNYQKATPHQVTYIKELLSTDLQRLKNVLKWQNVSSLEDLPASAATIAINQLVAEQVANKDTNLISPQQVTLIKKLVNPERLIQLLSEYKLDKLEEMKISDYYKEYDRLRLEVNVQQDKQQQIN